MLNRIKEELQYLKIARAEVKKRISEAPNGKLRCAICRGNYQYYIGKRYLKVKEKKLAIRLAEKEYSMKIDKQLGKYERALEVIEDFIENERLQNIYRELHPARKALVTPVYRPIEDITEEFEAIIYEGKGFDESDKTSYYTIKGERVRSKSEKIIADELYRYRIPYRYEMPIELQGWNKKLTFYPDFIVLNRRTGKKWILEHLGMMDKASYFESAIHKLDTYEKNDILLGRDLILLHETSSSPLNTKCLQDEVKNREFSLRERSMRLL